MSAGNYSEAFKHLDEAVRLRPDVAEYQMSLGMAAIKTGDKATATVHYETARRILAREAETDPDRVDDYAMVMTLLAQQESARDVIQDGLKRFPESENLKALSGATDQLLKTWSEFSIGK